jgi:hypothetical protein
MSDYIWNQNSSEASSKSKMPKWVRRCCYSTIESQHGEDRRRHENLRSVIGITEPKSPVSFDAGVISLVSTQADLPFLSLADQTTLVSILLGRIFFRLCDHVALDFTSSRLVLLLLRNATTGLDFAQSEPIFFFLLRDSYCRRSASESEHDRFRKRRRTYDSTLTLSRVWVLDSQA